MNVLYYLLLVFAFLCRYTQAQPLSVMSYNIRYDNPNDKENAWTQGNRKEKVLQIIQNQKPDIIGIQEGLHHQVKFLSEKLPVYQYVGVGRDDGKESGEYTAIFFNAQKFELIDKGYFWLSQTPEIPSKGWDATCCNRITTWVKLKTKDSSVYVFNTHFDHEGQVAQLQSALLLKESILPLIEKNHHVILMGDLNITPNHPSISTLKTFLNDTFTPKKGTNEATFNAFNLKKIPTQRIDYILISKNIGLQDFEVVKTKIQGLYPSDHFPIKAEVELLKKTNL